jgi:hypothetical protein
MEFYAVARVEMSPIAIQRAIHVSNLAELCASIDKVLSHQGDRGEIYCIWGEFKVHRELIRQGVRFTLPGCPNALQWTVSKAVDEPGCVYVHGTIDRPQHDADFIESLQQFVDDWKQGLESGKAGGRKVSARPAADCMPIYG